MSNEKDIAVKKDSAVKHFFSFKNNALLGPLTGLVALIIVSTFLSPYFLNFDNLINILRQNAMLGLVCIGMTTVIVTGMIDLSVGPTLAWCGIVCGLLKDQPFIVIFLAVIASGALIGFINGYLVAVQKVENFIATLGMMITVRGICLWVTHSSYISNIKSFAWIANDKVGPIPVPVIILIVFYALFWVIYTKTQLGRNFYAIGGNRNAAKLSGVKVERVQIAAFMICSIMVGLAAIVNVSRLSTAESAAGNLLEADSIAAVLVGGASLAGGQGNIIGTFIGVYIFAILYNIMNMLGVQSALQQVLKGLIVIGAVLFRVRSSMKKEK